MHLVSIWNKTGVWSDVRVDKVYVWQVAYGGYSYQVEHLDTGKVEYFSTGIDGVVEHLEKNGYKNIG